MTSVAGIRRLVGRTWLRSPAILHGKRLEILALGGLLALVGVLRWYIFRANTAPPGSDGGQWLAFAHQLFTGETVRAGFDAYPPVIPLAVGLVDQILPPLMSLKLVGVAASMAIAVPMYLILRRILPGTAAVTLSVAIVVAPYRSEVVSFGGYPQLLGTALLLGAVWALLAGARTGSRRLLLISGAVGGSTAYVHVLVAGQTAVCGLLIGAIGLWYGARAAGVPVRLRARRLLAWSLLPAVLISIPALPVFASYLFTSERISSGGAPLATLSLWLRGSWGYELMTWGLVAGLTLPVLTWAVVRNRSTLAAAGPILMAVAIGGVVVFDELRFLELFEAGLILGLGVALAELPKRGALERWARAATMVAVLVAVTFAGVGIRRSAIAYDWYMVTTGPVLDAMEWLKGQPAESADTVIASPAPRGHNYAWWIEGYARRRAYMAGDPSLFIDPEEHRQVAIASELLDCGTAPGRVRDLVEGERVTTLFLDRRLLTGCEEPGSAVGFRPAFSNEIILVLQRPGG